MSVDPKRAEIWRHVKTNHLYNILFIGEDEATGEAVVIYRSLDHKKYPKVWVRKLSVFMETTADGFYRFERYECDR